MNSHSLDIICSQNINSFKYRAAAGGIFDVSKLDTLFVRKVDDKTVAYASLDFSCVEYLSDFDNFITSLSILPWSRASNFRYSVKVLQIAC